jgi:F-type H+-transporting ATPase subunit delta
MDSGVISVRYAKAIFQYALGKGEEIRLLEEMKTLAGQFLAIPLLKKVLEDPTVSASDKINSLITAAGRNVSDTYKSVIQLVIKNKRGHYMQNIALMYDKIYRKEKNIMLIRLTTVDAANEELKNSLIALVVKDKSKTVDFVAKTDTAVIGGFILEIEDTRLDASVKNQLNQLRLELIKN